MNSKFLIFLAVSVLLVGCEDKGSDKPHNNNNDVYAGSLDNINPYDVPANAMSQNDAWDLWQRARRAEAIIPSENTYLSKTAAYGELSNVSERERRQAMNKLNEQGVRFLDSVTRDCDINDFDYGRQGNPLDSSVGGRNCPMQSSYHSDTQRNGNSQQTTIVTNFNAARDMAQYSGLQYIRTQNSYTLEQSNDGRHRHSSSQRMYGKGQIDAQYIDGERVVGTVKYDIQENELKMVYEFQARRGALRVVLLRSRGMMQAFVNGREAESRSVRQGFVPARFNSGSN